MNIPSALIEQRLKVAHEFRDRFAKPDILTPLQAWLYSRNVRHQLGSPDILWDSKYSIEHMYNAQRLLHASQIAADCNDLITQRQCLLRAAQVLEWLNSTEDPLKESVPLSYLSAAAYQLAGLPAMAMNAIKYNDDLASNVLADFLRAKLNHVPCSTTIYWANRMKTLSDEPENHIDDIIRSIGLISSFLTLGDEKRISSAVEKLDILTRLTLIGTDSNEWLLCFLINEVAKKYMRDSIWVVLELLKETVSDIGWRKLRRFAKQACNHDRHLLWPSQKLGVERLAVNNSFVMCTPTGSGKTTIAHLAILQSLYDKSMESKDSEISPLVIYIVPSRALAAEAEASLEETIHQISSDIVITGLYGGSDWSITDAWLTTENPTVLVCTVEKAEALLRYLGAFLLKRLTLIIVDEAHQVGFSPSTYSVENLIKGESREQRLESFLTRLLTNCPSCRVIALSAVTEGLEGAIARWITGEEEEDPVGGNYRSTRQFIGVLSYNPMGPALINLELLDGSKLQLRERPDDAYVPLGFPSPPKLKAELRDSLYKYNECYSFWVASHFAMAGKRVLISITEKIEMTLESIDNAIMQWEGGYLPKYFSVKELEDKKQDLFNQCLRACVDYCGESSLEVTLLKHGIAVHHGQLPMKARRLMTIVIEKGLTPITIATSTLTEGVNLPFDVVLLPRVARERWNVTASRKEPVLMNPSEFLNLAGRAGRPGLGIEGMTLIVVPESPSATSIRQRRIQTTQIGKLKDQQKEMLKAVIEHKESEMRSPLAQLVLAIFNQWRIISGTKDLSEFGNWLEQTIEFDKSLPKELVGALDLFDEFLLSALHEAELIREIPIEENAEEVLRDLWLSTFAYAQSKKDSSIYEMIFQKRGVAITESIIPEQKDRHRIYRLGLTPQKAKRFPPFREAMEEHLQAGYGYSYWKADEQLDFISNTAKLVAENNDFGFSSYQATVPVNIWPTILKWWLSYSEEKNPNAKDLRYWLGFCNTNFDFKVGLAVGAVISDIWAERADTGDVPSLRNWEEIMELPWIAFWIRELMRWGTLDPFIAYVLSRGIANSRNEASLLKENYKDWYEEQYDTEDANDFINPIKFREWEKNEFPQPALRPRKYKSWKVEVTLEGEVPQKIRVFPAEIDEGIIWFDMAGYFVAKSQEPLNLFESQKAKLIFWLDFELSRVTA